MPEYNTTRSSYYQGTSTSMMTAQSPNTSMSYESPASTGFEVVTPDEENDIIEQPAPLNLCTWRTAHTLKNQNGTKIETPTAPALVFW